MYMAAVCIETNVGTVSYLFYFSIPTNLVERSNFTHALQAFPVFSSRQLLHEHPLDVREGRVFKDLF